MHKPEINSTLAEAIGSARTISETLLVRLRDAHTAACCESPTVAERLVNEELLRVLEIATDLRNRVDFLSIVTR